MCIHLFNSILHSQTVLSVWTAWPPAHKPDIFIWAPLDGLVRLDRLASGPGFDIASGLCPSI